MTKFMNFKLLHCSCTLSALSFILNIYYVYYWHQYNIQLCGTALVKDHSEITEMEELKVLDKFSVSTEANSTNTLANTGESIPNGFAATNSNPLYWKYFQKLFTEHSDINKEQFTIVIMTYKRVALLRKVIPHYCKTGQYLNKIIIIWNDVGEKVPEDITNHECAAQLVIKLPTNNLLTNKFFPYSDIETDAVFVIDDDRIVVHEDLVFAFQSWQQYRHRILGFESRTHTILPDGSYQYSASTPETRNLGYSLVLTIILHKAYLEMYQMEEFLDRNMINYINEKFNCEDLAMCIMVADFLANVSYPQTSCIGMKPKHYPYNLEAQNRGSSFKGLSMRKTHVEGRRKCLNEFRKYYKNGRLPIHYTNVLFVHEPASYYKNTE